MTRKAYILLVEALFSLLDNGEVAPYGPLCHRNIVLREVIEAIKGCDPE